MCDSVRSVFDLRWVRWIRIIRFASGRGLGIVPSAMNELDSAGVARLEQFLAVIGAVLGSEGRRASFATYMLGLLSDGERKSIEPIAARSCPDPKRAEAEHQRLHHFVANGKWDDRAVRRTAAEYGISAMTSRETVEAWILDDTGFIKQGTHSVGVQRQYTGSAGKVTNCQVGVSLTIATQTDQLPIDFELYLGSSWLDDPARCLEARIPGDVVFKTKPQLALEMVRRALDDGVPRGIVLGDSAYGAGGDFRLALRKFGLHYSLGVHSNTTVFEVGQAINRGGKAIGLRDLAFKLMANKKFRRCTWRAGTKEDLTARFAMRRVFPCAEKEREVQEKEPVWLLIEWRDGDPEPANYFFASLPKSTRRKALVRLTMQRWRTERVYEDLKGEFGLDHYEGRRFQGWHHHVSAVLCCYAFVISERWRHFSPSTTRSLVNNENLVAA